MNEHTNDIQQELRKTEEEFNRLSNPMLHFGLTGAAAETAAAAEPVVAPAADASLAVEPSPQLELGLGNAAEPVAGSDRQTSGAHVS